jgi:hypothetical protein
MFSGIQEILLIVVILLGIFLLPRMLKPQPPPRETIRRRPIPRLSWTLRLAIVVSILWVAAWTIHLKPWRQDVTPFVLVGLGPVVVGWSLRWVLAGLKNKR